MPSPVRWQESFMPNARRSSKGAPVLREPASPVSEARRAKAPAARRERRAWMPEANVRRRGTGDPEATCESEASEAAFEGRVSYAR